MFSLNILQIKIVVCCNVFKNPMNIIFTSFKSMLSVSIVERIKKREIVNIIKSRKSGF